MHGGRGQGPRYHQGQQYSQSQGSRHQQGHSSSRSHQGPHHHTQSNVPVNPGAVVVKTNCFLIEQLPQRKYYQYNVSISPEVRDFSRRQEIIHKLRTIFAPNMFSSLPIYDGRNLLYVHSEVREGSHLVNVLNSTAVPPPVENQRGTYRVSITKTGGAVIKPYHLPSLIGSHAQDPNVLTEITMSTNILQLILKQDVNQKYPHNARAFYKQDGYRRAGRGLEMWRGYFYSVRPTIGRMIINLDTTMTAVYQRGNLVQLAIDFLDRGNQNPRQALNLQPRTPDYVKLEQFLKNVKIIVTTTGRTKIIRGLEPNADGFIFTNRDGDQVTVGQYMEKAYNLRLKFRSIIGVRLTGPRADRPEIVPLELCEVKPGQLYKKKLPQGLTESARSFATMKPNERMSHIEGQKSPIPEFILSEYVVQAQMKISQVPIEIQGKILQPPSIRFAYPHELSPHAGSWNVVGHQLFQPRNLHTWAVVWFVELSEDAVKRHIKGLQQSCAKLGMFPQGRMVDPVAYRAGHGNNPEKALQQALTEVSEKAHAAGLGPQILQQLIFLVILPQSAEDIRRRVKHWSDITKGIRTQCVRIDKLSKANDQYHNNVALKLNARLGGRNFVAGSPAIDWFKQKATIIMGADVGHPGPGVQRPSVTSLVWSFDQDATRYCATTRIQDPRVEHIQDLGDMARTAIEDFMSANPKTGKDGKPVIGSNGAPEPVLPQRIVFFRDGLSEGEYDGVAREEIKALKAVWEQRGVRIDLTYVVVGKRHHIAFFPDRDSYANDGKGNAKAGFVADTALASPLAQDFYLQSHAAIIGTSRSSHYILIVDENGLGLQHLQELAFSLCHVYAKATRSVSIPAPVYYADLACDRLKFHIAHNDKRVNHSDSSIVGDEEEFNLDLWRAAYAPVNGNVLRSMYFI